MGVLGTSKNLALLVVDSNNAQEIWKHKGKETKNTYSNPKENTLSSDGTSSSKKKKKLKKAKCPYNMRGFHPESRYMNKTIDRLTKLLEHNNISLPQGAYMSKAREHTEQYERCHALKAGFTQSKACLID